METRVRPYGLEELQRWVPVPPVPMRPQFVRETHEALGHVGRDKLAEALCSSWWWPGMRAQAALEVGRCPLC